MKLAVSSHHQQGPLLALVCLNLHPLTAKLRGACLTPESR